MKISLICVYNETDKLNNELIKSLNKQNINIELILLDSNKDNFKSAAEALNRGARQSTGDILIFSHQDIYIKEQDGIEKFARAIEQCPEGSIVGTQGVREKSNKYYSNLTSGDEFNANNNEEFPEKLIEVSSVDEGFFGMKRNTWERHNFNENICDNWHLYAVEQSLYARKCGHKAYVYPIQLHHFSYGTISIYYMKGMKKLCSEYKDDFKYIWTTCYKVRTNKLYINSLIFIWTLNRKIHRRPLQ